MPKARGFLDLRGDTSVAGSGFQKKKNRSSGQPSSKRNKSLALSNRKSLSKKEHTNAVMSNKADIVADKDKEESSQRDKKTIATLPQRQMSTAAQNKGSLQHKRKRDGLYSSYNDPPASEVNDGEQTKPQRKIRKKKHTIDTFVATPTEPKLSKSDLESDLKSDLESDLKSDPYSLSMLPDQANSNTVWLNKQRVLVLSSRGVTHRHRFFLENLRSMMPHSKVEPKWDKKCPLPLLNEVCESHRCNSCVYLESRRNNELYMWVSRTPDGPCMKFQVLNVYPLQELRLPGNCLRASRPLLVFDRSFRTEPHLELIQSLFIQIFGTPRDHPQSQPFYDHVMALFYFDRKIWFRHYQITPMTSRDSNKPKRQMLLEIGPRYVLDLIKIFEGSFGGMVLYENPHYISPMAIRQSALRGMGSKYAQRCASKHDRKVLKKSLELGKDPLNASRVFLPEAMDD